MQSVAKQLAYHHYLRGATNGAWPPVEYILQYKCQIVRLSDTRGYYSFELVAVQQMASPVTVPSFMGNVQEIGLAQFRQAWLDQQANPFAVMESAGMVIMEEDRSRRGGGAKRRNNLLELS